MRKQRTPEQKQKWAAYMREYLKKNPQVYAAMLQRQRERKTSTRTYRRRKDEPEFKEMKAVADRTYYARNRERILNERGAKVYGMTPEEYAAKFSQPCEICGGHEERGKTGGGMQVDHDHDTGENRGVLCQRCNRGLGYFKDDPERMEAAAAYVRRYRKEKAA